MPKKEETGNTSIIGIGLLIVGFNLLSNGIMVDYEKGFPKKKYKDKNVSIFGILKVFAGAEGLRKVREASRNDFVKFSCESD